MGQRRNGRTGVEGRPDHRCNSARYGRQAGRARPFLRRSLAAAESALLQCVPEAPWRKGEEIDGGGGRAAMKDGWPWGQ